MLVGFDCLTIGPIPLAFDGVETNTLKRKKSDDENASVAMDAHVPFSAEPGNSAWQARVTACSICGRSGGIPIVCHAFLGGNVRM